MNEFVFEKNLKNVDKQVLEKVADMSEVPEGAYNIRKNGEGITRHSTDTAIIQPKEDKPGIDITIKANAKDQLVHIPVILTESGINDLVYNDFYIEENASVTIIAGCGIHNEGCETSEHDGVHTFHIGKNSSVKYIEKHYGEGSGTGEKILNPKTIVEMDEDSYCEMEMIQIKGVDSTYRETTAHLKKGAKYVVFEKLMTHGKQTAKSDIDIFMDGEDASAQIVSRSVGKDESVQIFHPNAIGNAKCRAHIRCDSIIMDNAQISSIPAITANNKDAQIVHEAAIGKINNDQLIKLQTFGLSEDDAEQIIVEGFLK